MNGARRLKKSEQLGPDARYELLLRLASGGMGAVFVGVARAAAGIDVPLYAIKRAHAHLIEQAEFRKMFVAEAQLARRIHHPNAVGVIDVDESDGELMMIMRYVEGGSLSDMLVASHERGRRITPPVTLRIIADAARGLEAAHALRDERGQPLGIVHRDVSPHNILVGLDGIASIVDFGVAKAATSEATRTATDIMKGKVAYMAPEYVKSRVANAQTDVFGLGIVAWEALANRRLFKGENEIDTMKRLLDPSPAPLLHQIVDLDPTVAAVVARAVAKDPQKRFPSSAAFGEALENAARAADLLASPAEVASTAKTLLAAALAERRQLLADALAERARSASPRPVATSAAPITQLAPRGSSPAPPVASSSAPPAALAAIPLEARPTMSMGDPRLASLMRDRPPPSQMTAWMPNPPLAPELSADLSPPMSGPVSDRGLVAATSVMAQGYPLPASAPARSSAASIPHLESFHESAPTQAMEPGARFEPTGAVKTQRLPRTGSARIVGVAAGLLVVVLAVLGVVFLGPDRQAAAPPVEGAAPPAETVAPGPAPAGEAAQDGDEQDEALAASAAPTGSASAGAEAEDPPSTSASTDPIPAPSTNAVAPSPPPVPRPGPATGGPRPRSSGGSWRPKANPY